MGFLHGELTSLLWGGAFGFVWLYVAAARGLTRLHPLAKSPRGTLDPTPSPNLSLRFQTSRLPPAPAFFSWWLCVEGEHAPSRRFSRRVPLLESLTLPLELLRGRYQVTAHWELADVFGLTRFVPAARWRTIVTVEPDARSFRPPPPATTKPGPWKPRRSGQRAGDPFDVRKYTAGDDLRRLHWPLYAHAGVLFVRTAEPSPPPTGHQFLVLDTEAPSEEALDERLGALLTWTNLLDSQGTGWTLQIPAFEPGTPWAGLHPAPLPEPPPNTSSQAVVLTGPGNRASPWGKPWVVPFPTVKTTKRPWWRRHP